MAKDPAFLFYPGDWLGGTLGMTFEEKGAYLELLMLQFNRGHMTSHMIGQTVGQLWVKLEDKFIKDEKGCWYNIRLEEEQNKRKAFTDSRKNNKIGKNQFSKPNVKEGHMTSHMENENENRNENKNINKKEVIEEIELYPTFEDFWFLYDKKVGDKKKLKKKWDMLKQDVKEKIIEYLPEYIESTFDKKYRKNPESFLNQEAWNNEIIHQSKNKESRIEGLFSQHEEMLRLNKLKYGE